MAWAVAALGVLLAVPLHLALVGLAPGLAADAQLAWLGPGVGLGAGAAVLLAWRVPFLLVLDHELAHLLAAVLCLRKPMGLRVGEETGLAEYSRGRGSNLILLAPYGWPWLAWGLCGLLVVVQPAWRDPVVGAIGAALGFSAVRIGLDLRPYQTDLQRVGLVPAVVAVLAWGPLLFVIPALFATGRWVQVEHWWVMGWVEAQGLGSAAVKLVQGWL